MSGSQRLCSVLVVLTLTFFCLSEAQSAHHFRNRTSRPEGSKQRSNCNLYEGKWIFDSSYPLYDSLSCPFVRKEFNCLRYGRPNQLYLKFKWQPTSCDLPRFDGQDFLRRFRGKKIMFIGDSLSLNNWQSLICLLHAAVPHSTITQEENQRISTVTFKDYGVSVMLYHSLFLVDVEEDNAGRVLKLDSLKSGNCWKDMDVLIFNTWLWWYRRGPKQPLSEFEQLGYLYDKRTDFERYCRWDYVEDNGTISKDIDRMAAFRKGLTTWAKWVDSEVDPAKTKVFFQGVSPSHYRGSDWGEPQVKNCFKETEPLSGSTYPAGLPTAERVVKEVLSTVRKPVNLLDITTLSQLRKDAHPSSYNGLRGMDCTHWCIAGLPDTWNEILYATLIS